MKKLYVSLLLLGLSTSGFTQQFCAPGACWIYGSGMGTNYYWRQHYQHIGDTLIDGVLHHRIVSETRVYTPFGISVWPDFMETVRMEGAAVLSDHSNMTFNTGGIFDTIQYFGNIGERWWPPNADMSCPPQGMLQIMDTGHVVVQGIALRTTQMAYLDINGVPMITAPSPFEPFTLTERIGMAPRMPHTLMCGISEAGPMVLEAYIDSDIRIPEDAICDLPTAQLEMSASVPSIRPNPGRDELIITGLPPVISVEVRDAMGRLVIGLSPRYSAHPIDTGQWSPGTYFITVVSGDEKRALRWVKQ